MPTVKEIDSVLPQTQCGECGYPGCLPYAEALAQGLASIDKCPPGGVQVLRALGVMLQQDPEPYLKEVQQNTRAPSVAVIQEDACIGCTKCITACPVDAIVGSAKSMHSVLSWECTGCGLCVAPCPVDCIDMVNVSEASYDQDRARLRFQQKKSRELREEQERSRIYRERRLQAQVVADDAALAKKDYILKALERAQAKKK